MRKFKFYISKRIKIAHLQKAAIFLGWLLFSVLKVQAQLPQVWPLGFGKVLSFEHETPRVETWNELPQRNVSYFGLNTFLSHRRGGRDHYFIDSIWYNIQRDTATLHKENWKYNSIYDSIIIKKVFGNVGKFLVVSRYNRVLLETGISLLNPETGSVEELVDLAGLKDTLLNAQISVMGNTVEFQKSSDEWIIFVPLKVSGGPKDKFYTFLFSAVLVKGAIQESSWYNLNEELPEFTDTIGTWSNIKLHTIDHEENLLFYLRNDFERNKYPELSNRPSLSALVQAKFDHGKLQNMRIIKRNPVFKEDLDSLSGEFYLWRRDTGYYQSMAFSANDSLLYGIRRTHKIDDYYRFGTRVYDYVWNGGVSIDRYAWPEFELMDSYHIPGSFSEQRSSAFDHTDLRTGPDGNLYFIRNGPPGKKCELVRINKPNERHKLKEQVDTNFLYIDTIYKWTPFFNFPVFNYDYASLSFRKGKRCTDELRLFAVADSIFTNFEWYISNDSNGYDILKGKNIRYKAKGRRAFEVKLMGKTADGYHAWYTDTVSFNTKPIAKFETDTNQWCQWVDLKLINKSQSENSLKEEFSWQLIQNDSVMNTFSGKDPDIRFKTNGNYKIRLIYDDGFCTDSFEQTENIYIIPAPKPGFQIKDSAVCENDTVLIIDEAVGAVVKRSFKWADGFESNDSLHSRFFENRQAQKVLQKLTGPTGCVTKDSAWIRVRKAFSEKDSANLSFASVVGKDSIELAWLSDSNAQYYEVWKNNLRLSKYYGDSTIINSDLTTDSQSYTFKLRAIDSCGNFSSFSNIAKTLLLSHDNLNNEIIKLKWNVYEEWSKGVEEYRIEYSKDEKNWNEIGSTSDTHFQESFRDLLEDTVFYRVKAIEQSARGIQSLSNVIKVPLTTTIYIPNAFSPNGDGINDVFKIGYVGISKFSCKIFASTGQVVAYSKDPDNIWDGNINEEPLPIGNYFYLMELTDIKGEQHHFEGNIRLIR